MYTVLHNSNLEIHGFWPKALQIHGFFEKKIFHYIYVTSRNAVLSCTDFFWNQKPRISRPCCMYFIHLFWNNRRKIILCRAKFVENCLIRNLVRCSFFSKSIWNPFFLLIIFSFFSYYLHFVSRSLLLSNWLSNLIAQSLTLLNLFLKEKHTVNYDAGCSVIQRYM